MRVINIVIILFILSTFIGCQTVSIDSINPYQPVVHKIKRLKRVSNIQVYKDGDLVIDEHFSRDKSRQLNSIHSITKSISAILIGITKDQNLIDSVHTPLNQIFPEYESKYPMLKEITVHHLLTMKSGWKWDELKSIDSFFRVSNATIYALNRELLATPGSTWNYDSAASHLISVVIERISNQPTLVFSIKNLFEPIGIKNIVWRTDAQGTSYGSIGIEMTIDDLLKIGRLILQKGKWDGKQIITKDWIDNMMTPAHTFSEGKSKVLLDNGYGYLWWLGRINDKTVQYAQGYGGQFLFIVPDDQIIIAVQSEWDSPEISTEHALKLKKIIVSDLIPKLISNNTV